MNWSMARLQACVPGGEQGSLKAYAKRPTLFHKTHTWLWGRRREGSQVRLSIQTSQEGEGRDRKGVCGWVCVGHTGCVGWDGECLSMPVLPCLIRNQHRLRYTQSTQRESAETRELPCLRDSFLTPAPV